MICIIIQAIIVSPTKLNKSIFEEVNSKKHNNDSSSKDENDALILQVTKYDPTGKIDFGNDLVLQNKYLTSRIEKLEDNFNNLSERFEKFVNKQKNEQKKDNENINFISKKNTLKSGENIKYKKQKKSKMIKRK